MTPLLQQWLLDHDMLTGRVHHMDALGLLSLLPDASVDLISTDPPFNVDKAAWDSWETVEAFIAWLDDHLREMRRVLKPNGSLYLFCATKYAADVEIAVRKHFNVLNTIRWKKPNSRANGSEKEALRAYFPASESIVFAEQYSSDDRFAEADYLLWGRTIDKMRFKLRAFTEAHKDAIIDIYATDGRYSTPASIRVNASRQMGWLPTEFELMTEAVFNRVKPIAEFGVTYADLKREHEDLRREYEDLRREYEDLRRPFYATPNSPYTDVWEFPTVNTYAGKHVCEKPLSMAEHIVRISSRPNALVLDPFAGSGNLLRGAFLQGRRYIGGDADRYWAGRANDRVKQPFNLSLFDMLGENAA